MRTEYLKKTTAEVTIGEAFLRREPCIMMINVAIDGPAGAGKSTISKEVAARLSFIYVDTGALYRAIGLYALRKGIGTKNEPQILSMLEDITVELKLVNGAQRVFLCGEDVSEYIRTPQVSMAASDVSAIKGVRDFLLSLQRDIARENDVIMDGRDIGTVVLPDAKIKIFLTASAEERAMRRYLELREKGEEVIYEEILSDIVKRDRNDSNRTIAPLKPAGDSIIIDTTGNELPKSIDILYAAIKERLGV